MSRGALATVPLALAVLSLTFSNSFSNSFHYDDLHSIVDNSHIRHLANVPSFFVTPESFTAIPERAMYRPIVTASYAVNYWLGQYNVFGYHVVNVAVHAVCVLLVYGVARSLGMAHVQAGAGAFLFGIHPIQTEVVNYVSSRSESLAALGFLASLLTYLRWRREGQRTRRWAWYALSLCGFAMALASKSTAVVLPAAVLLYEALGRRSSRHGVVSRLGPKRLIWYHSGYWMLALAYLFITHTWAVAALGNPVRPIHIQILTQLKAFCYYAKLLIMPVGLSVDHQFQEAAPISSTEILCLALLVFLATIVVRVCKVDAAPLFAGWALLALLPASIVPLNVLVNEHRLYLAFAFVALLSASFLYPLVVQQGQSAFAGKTWGRLGVALLLIFAVIGYGRNGVWATELTLWQDAVRKAPGMYRPHLHLGGALESDGDLRGALRSYRQAAAIAPEVALVYYNLGNAFGRSGLVDESRAAYNRCLRLNPNLLHALLNLATLEQEAGNFDRAKSLLTRARDAHPSSAPVRRHLGVLYKADGQIERARQAYAEALDLDPHLAEAHYNLANLHYDARQLVNSARHYTRAIAIEPDHMRAYYNLADLYVRQQQFAAAEETSVAGLAVSPEEIRLHYPLAKAREGLGKRDQALASYRRLARNLGPNQPLREAVLNRIRLLTNEEAPQPTRNGFP